MQSLFPFPRLLWQILYLYPRILKLFWCLPSKTHQSLSFLIARILGLSLDFSARILRLSLFLVSRTLRPF